MEPNTMTKQENFLKPLLDMMNRRMDELGSKIDANTIISQKALDEAHDAATKAAEVASRTHDNEAAIRSLERRHGKKLNLPPNLIYLLALGTVLLLAIIAVLLHVNIGKIGL